MVRPSEAAGARWDEIDEENATLDHSRNQNENES